MGHDLFHNSISLAELAIRALVVYLAVLLLLRMGGKRQLGQMSPTEFVAILLISNAVQNAMNGGDNSLTGGLVLAAILVFLSTMISVLTFYSHRFRGLFEGTPTLLVNRGAPIERHLTKERITLSELKVMLRKQGIHHLAEVQTAVLESDGTLSVTRTTDT